MQILEIRVDYHQTVTFFVLKESADQDEVAKNIAEYVENNSFSVFFDEDEYESQVIGQPLQELPRSETLYRLVDGDLKEVDVDELLQDESEEKESCAINPKQLKMEM